MIPKSKMKIKYQFSFSVYAPISELYYAVNPDKIEHNGSRDIASLVMLKITKYKGNFKNQY